MYKLTERRKKSAAPILEKYKQHLESSGRIHCSGFEKELRDCWGLGYQELKDLILALSKEPEFERLAAYHMQHEGTMGPVSEFKGRLAELYGVSSYDHSPEREANSKAYWKAE